MITEAMTHNEKRAVAFKAANILGTRGVIAGGYARDVLFNRVPKDMDIFVPIPDWGFTLRGRIDPQALLRRAQEILDLFGQEVDTEEFLNRQGDYGHDGAFVAIKSKPQENPEWQPIDIIFHRTFTGRNIVGFMNTYFDLDICKVYVDRGVGVVDPGLRATAVYARGFESYTRHKAARIEPIAFSNRVLRMRTKYDLSVVIEMPMTSAIHFVKSFLEMGVLHAAREVLQEQAQVPNGDAVRLNDGVRVLQALRGFTINWDDAFQAV